MASSIVACSCPVAGIEIVAYEPAFSIIGDPAKRRFSPRIFAEFLILLMRCGVLALLFELLVRS